MYHVLRGLDSLRGTHLYHTDVSRPTVIQAISAGTYSNADTVWLGNLTGEKATCRLDIDIAYCSMLDETTFVTAAGNPNAINNLQYHAGGRTIELGPYAIARLTLA